MKNPMKIMCYLILAFTMVFASSCSDDDSAPAASPTIDSTLTDSKVAYDDAVDGDWIKITKDEYFLLAEKLNDVNRIAIIDEDYQIDDSKITDGGAGFTVASDNGVNIPKSSYVFAFRFFSVNDDHSGVNVKVSDVDVQSGYSNLGNTLPEVDKGDHFFVIKGNNIQTSQEGFLAYYAAKNLAFDNDSRGTSKSAEVRGDSNELINYYDDNYPKFLYQGLSTTQKQW